MKPLPRIEGEVQRYQIGPDGDEWVKADDYALLSDYAALVQMERDSARAEVAENEGVIRVWRRRAETAEAEVERLKADIRDARGLMRGMIDAKDGRVARFLIERAERFIERTADHVPAQQVKP